MRLTSKAIAVVLLLSLATPVASAPVQATVTKQFLVTAYYSPKPNQCCYVRGSYEADVVLNGGGIHGASGVDVHPGMAAAPKTYAFGTRIRLDGIGTVTVEDRGGAIQALPDGTDRIDLWVGEGEEGLARALAFGLRRVTGTVYLASAPQPKESLTLASLSAPWGELLPFVSGADALLSATPARGDHSASVLLLQEKLKEAGFLNREATGFFGRETEAALAKFQKEWNLQESVTSLTQRTAAYLLAATETPTDSVPLVNSTGPSSPASQIRELQRTMRYLGYYRGRTSGVYNDKLVQAVFAFQRDEAILSSHDARGAGLAGPKTRLGIVRKWRDKQIAKRAEEILLSAKIDALLASRKALPSHFLSKGESGEQVRILQRLLAERGFLPAKRVTGYFGNETQKALIAYQKDRDIIRSEKDKGAGIAGPSTRAVLLAELRSQLLAQVRGFGWNAL